MTSRALTMLLCYNLFIIPLLVGFSVKHVLEKKIGTSLGEASSTPSGSNQTTTNEEPNPSTAVTDNEVNTAHYFMFCGAVFNPVYERLSIQ